MHTPTKCFVTLGSVFAIMGMIGIMGGFINMQLMKYPIGNKCVINGLIVLLIYCLIGIVVDSVANRQPDSKLVEAFED